MTDFESSKNKFLTLKTSNQLTELLTDKKNYEKIYEQLNSLKTETEVNFYLRRN